MNFKSFGQILQEMMDYLAGIASPITDLNIGSATRTLLEAVALVLAELHFLSQQLLSRFFVSTATGQWLDMRAGEYGLTRILDTPTTRLLTVSHGPGTPQVTIPVGWTVTTLPGASVQVAYMATAQTVLAAGSASVSVPVVSTTTGAATAIPDATTLRQQGAALAYIDSIVTAAVSVAGTDREGDDTLRARVLDRLRNPPGPGSAADYRRAVIDQFAGDIGSVAVVPLWAGAGTVEVLILGPDNAVPDGATISAVQAYLDTWAPVGASVTVAAPTVVAVDVRATVTIAPGSDWGTVEADARLALALYLDGLGLGEDALLAAEGDALWRTASVGGPSGKDGGNYAALEQRTGSDAYAAADIAIGPTSKAVSGTLTLTES